MEEFDINNNSTGNGSMSPFRSITGNDSFWDGSLPNPLGTPLSVSSTVPETSVAGLRDGGLLQDQVSVRPKVVVPTLSTVTHTVTRPVNTTGSSVSCPPGSAMGLNLPGSRPPVFSCGICLPGTGVPPIQAWSRPPWAPPMQPYPPFQAQGLNPFASLYWPQPVPFGQDRAPPAVTSVTSSTSVSRDTELMDNIKQVFADFKKSFSEELGAMSSRISSLESNQVSHSVPVTQEDDLLSIAPRSQEQSFLSEEEDISTSDPVAPPIPPRIHPSSEEGSPGENEVEETAVSSKDQLKGRVYTLLRDVAHVPFSSPPRPKKLASTFETSCGLVQEQPSNYKSFPESNHTVAAIQFVNDSLANKTNDKTSSGSAFAGFGANSFPGSFKSKDFEIHNSTIGKTAPVCDKPFSQLLGAKPIDGLRLSQSLWAKSENLLRSASHVLGTAEHFLSAVGSLLQDKDDLSEVKSLLLQVDQALGASQLLLMGTLGNFTLSKRKEILEKSSVTESLQDSLLHSPLTDKIFGLSLQTVQEEVNKTPQAVKVNVQLTGDGKRSVATVSSLSSAHSAPNKKRKVTNASKSSSVSNKPPVPKGSQGGKKSGKRK